VTDLMITTHSQYFISSCWWYSKVSSA